MGWGPNPVETAAAERAAAEAQERIEHRPLTPFERQTVNALERIAEALEASKPVPLEPLVGTVRSGVIASRSGTLATLLDAPPADLALAVDAGATALGNAIAVAAKPLNTRADYEQLAETVIDAALRTAVDLEGEQQDSGGQETAAGEEAAGGDAPPPAATSTND